MSYRIAHQSSLTILKQFLPIHLSRLLLWVSILCFIIGGTLTGIQVLPVARAQQLAPANHIPVDTTLPVEIIIPDLSIDLPIFPSVYSNGTFTTTTQGASYLLSSPLPGHPGNSIIYAHNWKSLFGSLPYIKKGAIITVVFSNNTKQYFTVTDTKTVPAHDVSILYKTKDTRLTLFTCTDFLDADRFVVTAKK